ncbi:MAG: helix-turn-helix domain-containing protein [Anaerolineae bacterium]
MPTASIKRETITVEEAAQRLDVHPATIKRYLHRGWLKGRKAGLGLTSQWLVYIDSIKEYQERVENPPQ